MVEVARSAFFSSCTSFSALKTAVFDFLSASDIAVLLVSRLPTVLFSFRT